MINFTAKSDINLAVAVTADMSTANALSTSPISRTLGNLTSLTALKARLYYSAPAFNSTATLKIKAGETTLRELSMTTGGSVPIDLMDLKGSTEITAEVTCASTGTNFLFSAWLEIEHPIILGA